MEAVQDHLAAIGYGCRRPEPQCWRVVRIGVPLPPAPSRRRDPATSRVLARWLERLAERGPEAPCQIRPMQPVSAVERSSRRR